MPQFDSDAEGADRQQHRAGLHLAHGLGQPAGKSKPMKKAKKERHAQPNPAFRPVRPEDVLQRNENDARRNQRLHHRRWQVHEVKRRQGQSERMRDGKGRDDLDKFPKGRGGQHQRRDE
jgi:hypothetical protein